MRDRGRFIHRRISGSNMPLLRRADHNIDLPLSGAPTKVPKIAPTNTDRMKSPTEEDLKEYDGLSVHLEKMLTQQTIPSHSNNKWLLRNTWFVF